MLSQSFKNADLVSPSASASASATPTPTPTTTTTTTTQCCHIVCQGIIVIVLSRAKFHGLSV